MSWAWRLTGYRAFEALMQFNSSTHAMPVWEDVLCALHEHDLPVNLHHELGFCMQHGKSAIHACLHTIE